MLSPAQPTSRALFHHTIHAGEGFGILDSDTATEPSNEPGYVRVFRRTDPNGLWRPAGRITDSEAARRYCLPIGHDSSD